MKKNMLMKAAALAFASGAIFSCSGTKELKFDTLETSEVYPLAEGRRDSVYIDVSLQIPVEGLEKDVRDRICNTILVYAFGDEADGKTPNDALKGYVEDKVKDYRETNFENLGETEEDGEETEAGWYTWNFEDEGRYEGEYNGWLSYTLNSYVYLGGAHGSTILSGLNFDKNTGYIISADDIFSFGYEEQLSAALRSHLKSSLSAEEYDMLFVTDITPNGNFVLSQAGITYIYGQYEIGPYVSGIIKVTVPWEELQSILK